MRHKMKRSQAVQVAAWLNDQAAAGELDGKTFPEVAAMARGAFGFGVTIWNIRGIKADFDISWRHSREPGKSPREDLAECVAVLESDISGLKARLRLIKTRLAKTGPEQLSLGLE